MSWPCQFSRRQIEKENNIGWRGGGVRKKIGLCGESKHISVWKDLVGGQKKSRRTEFCQPPHILVGHVGRLQAYQGPIKRSLLNFLVFLNEVTLL